MLPGRAARICNALMKRDATVHSRKLNRCMQSGQSQPPLGHVITFLGTREVEDAHFKNDPSHFAGWGWDENLLRKLSSVHLRHALEPCLLARTYLSEHCFQALNFSSPSLFFLHRRGIAAQLIFRGMIWCDRREQKATDWLLQLTADLSDKRALDCTTLQKHS